MATYFNQGVSASTGSTVYNAYGPVGAGAKALITCNLVNKSAAPVNIYLAMSSASATQAGAEYIEFKLTLAANGGGLERTGLILTSGMYLTFMCSADSACVARVWGKEE